MANAYRNSSIAPIHAEPLINAYNTCVERHMWFSTGQEGCAMEFLGQGGLLGHLSIAPNYLVTYTQQGFCYRCNQQYQQVRYITYTLIYIIHSI